ncbi:hypothetical protein ALI144C_14840 [Actinosynnema sp. ALI-1.44]|uniref:hypothetical protein n=1 Tax=Actinosynnema sp. ALI-1.44 TaxID=1933779 RepID=UPI00097BF2BE|nr:hypothetical protein [Actinosynnema sp. ALI-1.44]ONI84435.1 hypothetical protein ALI144C_14840 [Actinosynnema sp. ALI-1.44]
MNRRTRRALVTRVVEELGLAPGATHLQSARRVCELIAQHLGKHVEVRFAPLPDTARCVAGRTAFGDHDERAAEELADELLDAITDHRSFDDPGMPGHVRRIVSSFSTDHEVAHDVHI